jgi:glyoxylase-like metal-dependent hydrolase (beta-lactamase superfamily II)
VQPHPPFLNAGNAGPFTLDGTRSYRVGEREAAIIDPGPDVESHVRALVAYMDDAHDVRIVLTHRHSDHAGAAPALAKALSAEVWGPAEVEGVDHVLGDGDTVQTDAGALVAIHTPGHTEGHLCFHWPERNALFAGDLLLGRGATTWVAEYPGCVTDYMRSLERLRALELDVVYPAHGPALENVARAIGRFEAHRAERIEQVRDALQANPGATVEELLDQVYGGTIPSGLEGAAARSLSALVDHVREGGLD